MGIALQIAEIVQKKKVMIDDLTTATPLRLGKAACLGGTG